MRGSLFEIRAICCAVQDNKYTHWTAIEVLQKKQQARQSKARGIAAMNERKWGYPGPDPGILEGIYNPCFNQIHARNAIKHSEVRDSNNLSFYRKFYSILRTKSQLSSITSQIFMAG